MLFVKIDIAKRNHKTDIIDRARKTVRSVVRFVTYIWATTNWYRPCGKLGESVVLGMKAIGHYWLALYTHLRHGDFAAYVINLIQSDALCELYIYKTKNDAIDAVFIADVIHFGRYCEASVNPTICSSVELMPSAVL